MTRRLSKNAPSPQPASRVVQSPAVNAINANGSDDRSIGGSRLMWLPAELLCILATVSLIWPLERLVAGNQYSKNAFVVLVITSTVMIFFRWLRIPAILGFLLSALASIFWLSSQLFASSVAYGFFPTSQTLQELREALSVSATVFNEQLAPVPLNTGFIFLICVGVWFIATFNDLTAMTARSPAMVFFPQLVLIVSASLLGVEQNVVFSTVLPLSVTGLLVLAVRSAQTSSAFNWLDHDRWRSFASLLMIGTVIAIAAVFAGVQLAPRLPGAHAEPLIDLSNREREEKEPIEVISPLVEVQPQLTSQSDTQIFTVRANGRSYWRIAALDSFDGRLWRSNGNFQEAEGNLKVQYPNSSDPIAITQRYQINAMNSVWAPVAYLPTQVESENEIGLNYEAESATLIVDVSDQVTSNGLEYTVISQIPQFNEQDLRLLNGFTNGFDQRYLNLPSDFDPNVAEIARQVTAHETTAYGKARALQDWFRQNFTYDLDVARGHDINRIADFLAVRRGYCEQFAGSYAAMARSLGIPARVAVGFTTGEASPQDPQLYVVKGKNAHAWPEVFIEGAGWLSFEPTPGRGAPNTEQYTGVGEQQDAPPVPPTPQPPSPAEQIEQTQQQPDEQQPSPQEPTPTPEPEPQTPETDTPEAEEPDPLISATRLKQLLLLALIVAAIAAWIFGVPWIAARRELARNEMFSSPRARVAHVWGKTVALLSANGFKPKPSETASTYLARVRRESSQNLNAETTDGSRAGSNDSVSALAANGESLNHLAKAVEHAAYQRNEPPVELVEKAEAAFLSLQTSTESAKPAAIQWLQKRHPKHLFVLKDRVSQHAQQLLEGSGDQS